MATFPRTEAEILQLARQVINGLEEHAEAFSDPTVPLAELKATYEEFMAAMIAAQEAEAEAKLRYADKAKARAKLVDAVKTDLRYAELTARSKSQLIALGWGGRRPRTRQGAPGQVLGLEIVEEGAGMIRLSWNKPVDGGKVSAYKIERRLRAGGPWEEVAMKIKREASLTDQPRGVDLEYRVIAANPAGDGKESAVVAAVL